MGCEGVFRIHNCVGEYGEDDFQCESRMKPFFLFFFFKKQIIECYKCIDKQLNYLAFVYL